MMNFDLKQAFAPIQDLFHFVSATSLFGVIPLDIVAHVLVGYIVTKVMIYYRFSLAKTMITLFFLELGKEYYDSKTLANTLGENLKDFAFTFAYPAYYILKLMLRKRLNRNRESSR